MNGANPSFYAARGPAPARFPRLRGARAAEVCIVGGGLTGLSAARALARRGREVALVEARGVGWGASGRNGGQAVAGFAPPMDRVERLVGRRDARALWDAARDALARLDADAAGCALRAGFALAARRPQTLDALARWADRAARDYGYPALSALDRAGIARHVDSPRFVGGLFDPDARHLDPLAWCRKIAAGAVAGGAALFEESPAVAVAGGMVRTREGSVRARHVVLACNACVGALAPALAARIAPVASHVCVTAPLGAARAARLLPSGAAICDDSRAVDYFRRTPDHRLLFGGGAHASGGPSDRRAVAAWLRRRIARVFPELADAAIDRAWSGRVAATRNRLPDVGRTREGVWYAQGYSGEGLLLSGVAGRAIAAAIDGDDMVFDLLRRIPHRAYPPLRALWLPVADRLARMADAL